MMLELLLPLCGLLLTIQADTLQGPHAIVRAAIHAVETDSAARVSARLEARLRRDSLDQYALFGLATLARLQYDYARAERLYQKILALDSTPSGGFATYARLGLAQGSDAQGFSTRAAQQLAQARAAARASNDSVAEGEALLGLSLQRAFTTGIDAGLATLDTVEHLVPPEYADVHAERLRQRAALRGIVGQPGARRDAEQALALARRTGSPRLIGQALRSTAQLLQFEGKSDSSIAVLRQAEELYRRGHDRSQYSTALLWHVNALLAEGDFGQANELAHLALAEGQAAGNLFAVGSAYTGLGSITIFLNDYSAASGYLAKSIALFERVGDQAGAMKARDYLAVTALAAGDLKGARRQTEEVLRWYRGTQEATIEFSALRNLAIIAMHEKNWAAADTSLREAHALARRLQRPLWSAQLNYDDARLALFRGDLGKAEPSFQRYLATLDTSQHVFRHDARARLAEIQARRGNLNRAETEARQAWDELERWRSSLTDAQLRVQAFQTSPTEMSDRDAGVVRVLAALAHGGRAAESFELAEGRRARELADRLLQAGALRTGSESPRKPSQPTPSVAISSADVVAQIPDDSTAVLEFVTGSFDAPTTVFLLSRQNGTRGGLRAVTLPPADSFVNQIARFAALIQTGDTAAALARRLGDVLLQPIVNALDPGIRRLVIIPDGPLHRLPFDALRLRDGRYAAERYSISVAPSARIMVTLWQQRHVPDNRPMNLLAFGDPAFSDNPKGPQLGRSTDFRGDALPRLRWSGSEARRVAGYSPHAVVRVRKDATAAWLRQTDLTSFRVLHFATHALVDEHTAARTALALAPGGGETGLLGPDDLAALRLDADLVVLSSCRSGSGVVVNGEGLQGLTAPLVQAGARSLVVSYWQVGDRRTVKFIDAFYRHLAEGNPVGEALRAAKLEEIRRGAPPSVWAGFTAVGDPLVRVPLQERSRGGPWILAIAAVFAAIGVTYWLRIRRFRRADAP